MSRRFTASKLALADACPPSHVLDWIDEEAGDAAARGTGIHAALEKVPTVGIDAAVAGLPAEWARVARAVAATPWIAPLLAPGAASMELALAYCPATDTARVLGTGRDAYTNAKPGEMTGTADVLAVTDGGVVICDYKTGWAVTHPSRNHQLRFLAVAAARAFGRDSATVAIAYCKDGEDAYIASAEMDCLDMEAAAAEMRDIVARVQSVRLEDGATYRRGPHCTEQYCPARSLCPAWTGLVRHIIRNPAEVTEQTRRAISMGAIAEAYRMIEAASSAIKLAKAEVARIAYATPINLGEGRYYGLAAGDERVSSADLVHETLAKHASPEIAEAAIESEVVTSATKASIKKALMAMPVKERGPVWDALRKAGAIASTPRVKECAADELVAAPPLEVR